MEAVRAWLEAIITVTMFLGLVRLLIPKGSVAKLASFTGGLILLLVLLRPLMEIRFEEIAADLGAGQETVNRRREELKEETDSRLRQVIEAETSAYISDKAEELGGSTSAQVRTEVSPDGIPLPAEVEITGIYMPELEAYIEQELGIPAERQNWYENED